MLLKFWTVALGGVVTALLGVPGVAYIIDPRRRSAPPRGFRRVARLSELPKPRDGRPVPVQVVISDARRDAWTVHPEEVVGRVWLLRQADDSVVAFSSICPHLGCSINFDAPAGRFICPCHGGVFELTGAKTADAVSGRSNPPPRGMDVLAHRIAPEKDGDAVIEVQYEEFRQGLKEAVRKS